ncbi:hypothetical protein C8F01DRAFT_1292488 [Mycena amicta]|nr:hypothetical protein C8F01DRAFT_1292488 [Mycena amicta]
MATISTHSPTENKNGLYSTHEPSPPSKLISLDPHATHLVLFYTGSSANGLEVITVPTAYDRRKHKLGKPLPQQELEAGQVLASSRRFGATSRTRTMNDSGDADADIDIDSGHGYSSSEIFASIVPVESQNNILAGWNPPSSLDPSILDQSKFRRASTVTTSPPTRPSTPLPLAGEGLYPYAPHTIPRAARKNGLLALSMTRNTNGLGATASDDSEDEDEDEETSSFLSRLSMLAVDGESLRTSASPSPSPRPTSRFNASESQLDNIEEDVPAPVQDNLNHNSNATIPFPPTTLPRIPPGFPHNCEFRHGLVRTQREWHAALHTIAQANAVLKHLPNMRAEIMHLQSENARLAEENGKLTVAYLQLHQEHTRKRT